MTIWPTSEPGFQRTYPAGNGEQQAGRVSTPDLGQISHVQFIDQYSLWKRQKFPCNKPSMKDSASSMVPVIGAHNILLPEWTQVFLSWPGYPLKNRKLQLFNTTSLAVLNIQMIKQCFQWCFFLLTQALTFIAQASLGPLFPIRCPIRVDKGIEHRLTKPRFGWLINQAFAGVVW